MQSALSDLASVFADPGAPAAAATLDRLRARWPQFAPAEREALTPLARLAAERVQAARAPAPARPSGGSDDD
ncbi:MAG: ATP-dependent helicase RecQ, partial [Solirubrobacteraceae bacterium]|nr:ATP-dependent helicase RecQ [Solirubrobacteraceae bacterium]